ncbi:MAG TPA: monofunctional biosynthetic peptidoglycan transglycosylase [Chitinivibrionales bacterium]|nr:monofunctional biosynthetic peptidoglycan transglycosylase [Chitinivibrionales bacterium]
MVKYLSKILYFFWRIIKALLLTYAVVFSLAGTVLIVYGYFLVSKPFRDVKFLVDHNPSQTEYMKRYRAALRAQKKPDTLLQRFVPLDSISRSLQNAVVAAEDDGFYTHPGFDIEAILEAFEYNKDKNRIARGASTITQQLAKNLFCDHEKNFVRKAKEMGYTLLLEKYLDKNRILELYLNYAEWGDNIFGCEAASQAYFKKPCSRLTLNEASRLAAVLAMPSRVSPLNDKSAFIQKRVVVMANNLYRRHMLDDSGYTQLSGLPPPRDSTADSTLKDTTRKVIPVGYPENKKGIKKEKKKKR